MKKSHLIRVMCQPLSYWLESGRKELNRNTLQEKIPTLFDTSVEKPYTIFRFTYLFGC